MPTVRAAAGLFAAGLLAAAEPPPAPVRPAPLPPAEDSIAAAQRDLQALKAGRMNPEAPRVALPSLTTPDFSVDTPAMPRPSTPPPGSAAARKKSENWLVDAMQPRAPRPGDPADRAAPRPGDPAAAAQATDPDDPTAPGAAAGAETAPRPPRGKTELGSAARERTEPTVNPLTSFMAGWMTPQDFKLLQPTLNPDRATSRGAGEEFAAIVPATGSTADRLPLGKSSGDAASRAPRENPFLAALGPAPTPANAAPPVVAPAPVAPRPPVMAAPPPSAPAPAPAAATPGVPAFVKPLDEAKYFKPLKKF